MEKEWIMGLEAQKQVFYLNATSETEWTAYFFLVGPNSTSKIKIMGIAGIKRAQLKERKIQHKIVNLCIFSILFHTMQEHCFKQHRNHLSLKGNSSLGTCVILESLSVPSFAICTFIAEIKS